MKKIKIIVLFLVFSLTFLIAYFAYRDSDNKIKKINHSQFCDRIKIFTQKSIYSVVVFEKKTEKYWLKLSYCQNSKKPILFKNVAEVGDSIYKEKFSRDLYLIKDKLVYHFIIEIQ